MTSIEHFWPDLSSQAFTIMREIAAERQRQIDREGWSPDHDDEHTDGTLAAAGACYALNAMKPPEIEHRILIEDAICTCWPFDLECWKPKDPRRDLIRAAALIVAELERLDRRNPLPAAVERTKLIRGR